MLSLRTLGGLIIALAFNQVAVAQTPASSTGLALEVHFYPNEPPAFQKIYKTPSGGAWYSRFHQIKPTGPNDLPVNAVDIKPALTDSGVSITVSVLFGELHEQQKQIGVYTVHEGEKFKIEQLAQYGIDPFIISVVDFSPAVLDVPEFISKAPSIDYIGIQPAPATTPAFRVAVRNLSSKSVRAIEVRVLKGATPKLAFLPQGKEGAALIAPGNAFEFDARVATQPTPTSTGYSQVTLPGQVIEVVTAIFEDGSFEGEAQPALTFAASLRGEKIELARVIDLFQRAIDDNQSDAATRIETLKKNLALLNLEADPALAQQIMAEFGRPVNRKPEEIKGAIEVGMRTISMHALNVVKQFQLRNPNPQAAESSRWLTTVNNRYNDWLRRL